tara:strand:+ start:17 stop:577 length:561 start_codon:yes stop_codon:yes gene_type:complete
MATRWDKLPNPMQYDTKTADRDADAVKKALNPPKHIKGGALDSVRAAGMRGGTRLGGAAGLAGLAYEGGKFIGRKIDEKTGAGKKIVDETVGPSIDRVIGAQDRVTLSPEAKARIDAGELDKKETKPRTRKTEGSSPEGKLQPGRNPEIDDETRESAGGYKKGGKVSASNRADGIAQRGKTKGRMC